MSMTKAETLVMLAVDLQLKTEAMEKAKKRVDSLQQELRDARVDAEQAEAACDAATAALLQCAITPVNAKKAKSP